MMKWRKVLEEYWWSGEEPGEDEEEEEEGERGQAVRRCSVWSPGFMYLFILYLVLDLNFFPKALSSSGTDRVRVKEPSDSDRTTRASG